MDGADDGVVDGVVGAMEGVLDGVVGARDGVVDGVVGAREGVVEGTDIGVAEGVVFTAVVRTAVVLRFVVFDFVEAWVVGGTTCSGVVGLEGTTLAGICAGVYPAISVKDVGLIVE